MSPSDSVSGDGPKGMRAVAEAAAPGHDARSMALVKARLFGADSSAARIGRYELVQKRGEGAMGVVYEARDGESRVALKLIRESGHLDPAIETRLQREAHALARLDHPNIVSAIEFGEHEGQRFVAMELVDGPRLDRWIEAEDPGWREILEVFIGAGRGLAAAHDAGLVHRDFKPANVLLDEERVPHVVDFGLVRALAGASEHLDDDHRSAAKFSAFESVTKTGAIVGTPAYMAPEQLEGQRADARTDQFNYCVALFESLYRARPFAGLYLQQLLANVLAGQVAPRPPGTEVPMPVHEVIVRGLEVEPQQRWPSMHALLEALERAGRGERTVSTTGRRWLVAVFVLLLVGLALSWLIGLAP